MSKKIEPKIITFKNEGRFFFIGAVLGCILGILWQDIFVYRYLFSDLKSCVDISKIESNVNGKFIDYINGKWSSSIGDLIIQIDNQNNKNFIVVEDDYNKVSNRVYTIQKINKVNGILGVMNLDICQENIECDDTNIIPIQINKIFGREKTIAISYDQRLTYCVDSEEKCTRAFKRLKY